MSTPRQHRQRAAGKRKADEDLPANEHASKKSAVDHGSGLQGPELASGGHSEEALFKIRHAAEFDTESIGDNHNQVRVKHEQKDDASPVLSPMRLRSAAPTPHRTASTPAAGTPQRTGRVNSSHWDVDQESVFVAILSKASWDFKMTESAIENLSHRAREMAAHGQVFDVEYVNSIFERLDGTAIEAGRRSQVVKMLKDGLQEPLGYWQSCIDQIGSKPRPLSISFDHHPSLPRATGRSAAPTPSSSKTVHVGVGRVNSDKITRFEDSHPSSDSSDATSDSDLTNAIGASDGESLDNRLNPPTRNWTTHHLKSSSGPSTTTDYEKYTSNVQVYGTRVPKAAFDIFARCTISAWAAAPHPDDTSTKIREYALLRWRKVAWEQKSVWQKLFEDRHDPATDVAHIGRGLLLSQDLLKVVVPENRLLAAKLHCEQTHEKHSVLGHKTPQLAEKATPLRELHPQLSQTHPIATPNLQSSEDFSQDRPRPRIRENFPRLTQATSDTPAGQPCMIASTARQTDTLTCLFILNSPDVRSAYEITEPAVSLACHQAKLAGLRDVIRQTHNVFVALFKSSGCATRARQEARLEFTAPSETSTPPARLMVEAESHLLDVNRVFIFETDTRSINHETVYQRVFEALEGPLASSFRLLKQQLAAKGGGVRRTRYILRPSEAVCPIFVERFYIPLDVAYGQGKVWGIFKPVNRHWKCPACHTRCQAQDTSHCKLAILLCKASTLDT